MDPSSVTARIVRESCVMAVCLRRRPPREHMHTHEHTCTHMHTHAHTHTLRAGSNDARRKPESKQRKVRRGHGPDGRRALRVRELADLSTLERGQVIHIHLPHLSPTPTPPTSVTNRTAPRTMSSARRQRPGRRPHLVADREEVVGGVD
eukprot:2176519-Rhodomonas_salina.2